MDVRVADGEIEDTTGLFPFSLSSYEIVGIYGTVSSRHRCAKFPKPYRPPEIAPITKATKIAWHEYCQSSACRRGLQRSARGVKEPMVMMTNGPRARVGKILPITLPCPRSRRLLLAHPEYYALLQSVLTFLEECDRH